MKKRIISLLMVLCLMLSLMPMAMATDVDGYTQHDTAKNITISTAGELKNLATEVNNGDSLEGYTVTLTENITLGSEDWTPIGNGTRSGSGYTGNAFKGVFDGAGKTITGLKISSTTGADVAVGLFGVVDGGTVKNLTLNEVNIKVSDSELAGGAIGLMVNGAIADHITVSGTVAAKRGNGGIVGRMTISGTISNCVNNAAVSGTGANVGGIVGAAYYTANGKEMRITACENHGTVSGTAGTVGGIVGLSSAIVSNCKNDAAITGNGTDVAGVVAEQQNYGSVSGCTNSSSVTNNSSDFGTGGIVGWVRYNGSDANYPLKGKIAVTGNTNSGSVTGGSSAGGIVGHVYNAASVTENTNTAASIISSIFAAGIVGSIQLADGNTYKDSPDVTVSNNVSTTVIGSIAGNCKDLFAYNNEVANPNNPFVITNNSTTDWAAQIGTNKYATLSAALNAAQSGDTITILKDINGDVGLYLRDRENITLTAVPGVKVTGNLTIGYHSGQDSSNSPKVNSTLTVKDITVNGSLRVDSADKRVVVSGNTANDIKVYTWKIDNMDIQILNNTVVGGGWKYGIYVVPETTDYDLKVDGNTISNVTSHALAIQGNGQGSAVTAAKSISVTNNNFTCYAEKAAFKIWEDTKFAPKKVLNYNGLTPDMKALARKIVAEGNNTFSTADGRVMFNVYDFSFNGWTITLPSGAGYTVTPTNDSVSPVLANESYSFTLTVNSGYQKGTNFAVKANGVDLQETDGKYILSNLTTDTVVTVSGITSIPSTPSDSGSSSNTSSTTEKNPDGSTTTTTTNKKTGTVTETTKNTDGSTTTVETKKDGTVTETNKAANGTTGTVVTDKNGDVTEVKSTVSTKAATEAAKSGEAVTLPVEVPAAKTTEAAPAVQVTVPKSAGSVKVEVPVEKVTPGTVAVIVKADGTEEIVKTSALTENGVVLKLDGNATVKVIDNSKEFVDVHPVSHWAEDAITFVTAREMFTGTSTTTFTPNSQMTRAQLMTVLARFDGVDTNGGSVWYEKGMEWAKANGVSDGSNPNGSITREQLATMLWRYSGSPVVEGGIDSFHDADKVSDYATDAMRWAVETGLIGGIGNNTLAPQGNATRAQLATILMRYCENLAQ